MRRGSSLRLMALAVVAVALGVRGPVIAEAPRASESQAKATPATPPVATTSVASVPAAKSVEFETQVVPILLRRCSGCHNPSDNAGGLNLLSREAALAGGKSGEPAIKPGDLDNSYAITRIEAGEMPPPGKTKPLSPGDLDVLKHWIASGAAWPKDRTLSLFEMTTDTRGGRDWWSLKPPVRPTVPTVKNPSWIRTPVDAFVLAKLEERGLEPSPEADRATLIRRATLDLLGLPPSPDKVREFVADKSPDAYERLIDRLLASPHYGERWGRHWMDVVRFAESDGKETNQHRDNAWPYRDYVIDSFNADKPYTQFITEQLAGDQMGAGAATGFLVAGATDNVKSPDVELTRMQRLGDLDDMESTTAGAFLGLTVGCAKCHDHKFDAISQHDYYALQAIFAGVQHGERDINMQQSDETRRKREELEGQIAAAEQTRKALAANLEPLAQVGASAASSGRSRPRVHPLGNVDRFAPVQARFVRFTVRQTNNLEPCLDELEIFSAEAQPRNVALASAGGVASASGVFANGTFPLHQLSHINDGRFGNSWSWISNEIGRGWVQIELRQPALIDRVAWARDREGLFTDRLAVSYVIEVATEPGKWQVVATSDDRHPYQAGAKPELSPADQLPPAQAAERKVLDARIAALNKELAKYKPQKVYAGVFERPEPTYRLYRGEPMQRREEVQPGAIVAVGKPLEFTPGTPEAERRMGLARWIADASNPLTARVMVNRIWHYHFGRGLMPQPSDFGFNGGHPSHPELLDWLATEFMTTGWRMKHIHRLILLSSAYRQADKIRPNAAAVDGGNVFLWRFSPRRLEAEAIRDSILSASGALDLTMGGPGFDLFEPNNNYSKVYVPKQSFGPADWRRMVYQSKPRMQFDSTFGAFDCPDSAQPLAKRNASTTALQALNLLNGPFVIQQADLFAKRLVREAPGIVSAQVERAFWLAFGRAPDADEQRAADALISADGLPIFCRAILNANELVYLP
jgi:hypothetical protein